MKFDEYGLAIRVQLNNGRDNPGDLPFTNEAWENAGQICMSCDPTDDIFGKAYIGIFHHSHWLIDLCLAGKVIELTIGDGENAYFPLTGGTRAVRYDSFPTLGEVVKDANLPALTELYEKL